MFKFEHLDSMITLLIGFIFITILVIIGTIFLKKKTEKTRLLPIKIVFVALLIMEVMKIYYLICKDGGFYPNRYPIVFCSVVLYTYPLFCFKKNKFSDLAKGISVIPCLISIIPVFLTVGDNALIRDDGSFSIIHFHSIIYHLLMYGVSLYLITTKLYEFKFKKSISIGFVLVGYVVMASVLGLLIKADISFFGYGFNSTPVFKFLYDLVGYFPGNLIISILMMLLSLLIYYLIDIFKKLILKRKLKEN